MSNVRFLSTRRVDNAREDEEMGMVTDAEGNTEADADVKTTALETPLAWLKSHLFGVRRVLRTVGVDKVVVREEEDVVGVVLVELEPAASFKRGWDRTRSSESFKTCRGMTIEGARAAG